MAPEFGDVRNARRVVEMHPPTAHANRFSRPLRTDVGCAPEIQPRVIFRVTVTRASIAAAASLVGGPHADAIDREACEHEIDRLAHPLPGFLFAPAHRMAVAFHQKSIRAKNLVEAPSYRLRGRTAREHLSRAPPRSASLRFGRAPE